MNERPKGILNLADVPMEHHAHGDAYEARDGAIGPLVGAKQLGYSITSLPPGKRAYPFHNHNVEEEMFLVLEGTGAIRMGKEIHAIGAGDVIACPGGGADTAHQIVNTGSVDLRFLAVSTRSEADVVEYPDSGKVSVRAGGFRFRGRLGAKTEYWEGE